MFKGNFCFYVRGIFFLILVVKVKIMDLDYFFKIFFKKKFWLYFICLFGLNIFQIMVLYLKKKIDFGMKKGVIKQGKVKYIWIIRIFLNVIDYKIVDLKINIYIFLLLW